MTRNEILELLADKANPKKQFNDLLQIYKGLKDKNDSLFKRLNRSGFTNGNHEQLVYEVKKLQKIKDIEVANFKIKNIEVEDEQLIKDTEDNQDKVDDTEIVVTDSQDTQKIRDEFPFLNDDDCPEVLLIAVGKKISAFKKLQAVNAKIHELTETNPESEELEGLAEQALKHYSDNEGLYAELKHYAEHKEVLGVHPLFYELATKKEVEQMTNDDMLKFVNSSKTYFSRKNNELKKAEGDLDKVQKIQTEIDQRSVKLKFVKQRLNIK